MQCNEYLKRERELKGWSQERLAEELGTTAVNVSRWERKVTTPAPYFRQKLCMLFRKTADELGFVRPPSVPLTPIEAIPPTSSQAVAVSETTLSTTESVQRVEPEKERVYASSVRTVSFPHPSVTTHLHEKALNGNVQRLVSPTSWDTLFGSLKRKTLVLGFVCFALALYAVFAQIFIAPAQTHPAILTSTDTVTDQSTLTLANLSSSRCSQSANGYTLTTSEHQANSCIIDTFKKEKPRFHIHMALLAGDCGGIIFADAEHGILYSFSIEQDGSYHIIFSTSLMHENFVGESAFIQKGKNTSNTLRVVHAPLYTLFEANGHILHSIAVHLASSGTISLFAVGNNQPTSVLFQNPSQNIL